MPFTLTQLTRLFLVALVVLALGACSSNKRKEESRKAKLVDFEATVEYDRLWSANVGEGKGQKYMNLVPAISDDRIFAANAKGHVSAFDLNTGKRLWIAKTDFRLSGGVAAGDGIVGFGTLDGKVVALDASNGDFLWEAQVSSEILAPPAIDDSVLVVQTIDARVFAFESKTGDSRWSYDHLTPVLSLRGTSAPVIVFTQVICAFDNGQIVSFSLADGSRTWEARISQPKGKTDLERIVDVDGTPVIDGGLIYAASYQGNAMAIGRAEGNPIWQKALSTYNRLASGRDHVFATTERSKVVALNSANGDIVWETEALLNRRLNAPSTVGTYVVTVDDEGYAHVLEQSDGELVERFKPRGKGFSAPMLVENEVLYILSNDGKLGAYTLSAR